MQNSRSERQQESREKPRGCTGFPRVLRPGLAAALLLLCLPLIAAGATIQASLDRTTIALGERAMLSVRVEGGNSDRPPQVPAVEGLQIVSTGPPTFLRYDINGQSGTMLTYNFVVTPTQVGEFTIPAITIASEGQQLATQPLKLSVRKPGASATQASGQELAFIRLYAPTNEVYVGQVIVAEVQLYLHNVVRDIGNFQVTAFSADGFNKGKTVEGRQSRARVGNSIYTVVPLYFPLTAIKAGDSSLGPLRVSFAAEIINPARRDPFDLLGFNTPVEQRQIALEAEGTHVRILPVPSENAPPGFAGAVGVYSVSMSVSPTNVAVGDPIRVRLQVSGRGALDSLTLPEQPSWKDFKVYPPISRIETADPLGIQGTKFFELDVVPEKLEIESLPEFSFAWFDPEQKAFQTYKHPAVPLTVRPAGTAPLLAGDPGEKRETAPPPRDILPIKQRVGALAQARPPLIQQPWFVAAQSVPVLLWIGSVLWRRRSEWLANNPRLRRKRQAAHAVRRGLRDLRTFAAANQSEQFFAALFRLLQEQLGAALDLPASSITEAVIDEQLRPRNVPEPVLAGLAELFQACNLARYAPAHTSQELAAYVPRVESLLNELRALTA
ncbi:MAG TPA: protein BatD [Verrucomicrobia bacterium]|nr:protein BatD [Verrucomicrobiota bacterium]HOP97780.1 BatD family protein [Verrucomicrobiota bacterium]